MRKKKNEAEEQVEKKSKKEELKKVVKDIVRPSQMVVDFGSDSIKVVYGNFNRKNIEIYGHNIMPSSKEFVDDGKILNPLEVATLLKSSISENKVNVKGLTLILSGSDVIIREIQVPTVDEREVGKIIEFEAQQYFPIELTQYMTDYKILEKVQEGEEEKLRVLLVAVPLEQIKDYISVAEFLGIELTSIDLVINAALKYLLGNNYLKDYVNTEGVPMEGMTLQKFLSLDMSSIKLTISNFIKQKKQQKQDEKQDVAEKQDDVKEQEPSKFKMQISKIGNALNNAKTSLVGKFNKIIKKDEKGTTDDKNSNEIVNPIDEKNFALLDMGAKTTSIYIYSNHRLKFTRTLLVGGSELDKKISQDLTMSQSDAASLKINKGSIAMDEKEQMLYEEVQGLNKAITASFSNILNDVGRFMEFYNSRNQDGMIEKIYLYGGASKLRGAREYMSRFFNVPADYLERGHYKVLYRGERKEDYDLNKRTLVNAIGGLIR